MNQIERIIYMEQLYDEIIESLKLFEKDSEQIHFPEAKINLLIEYYTSPQWLQDYEDDQAGKIPSELKRGVLSQDGIYLLLEKIKENK